MATGRHDHAQVARTRRDIYTQGSLIARYGIARNEYCEHFEDFLGDIGQTLPNPWKYTETGTSTNFTGDYVSAADGRFVLTHSADDEAQSGRIDWGDNLLINMSKKPRIEIRAKIDFAGATFSADQRAVFGLASAHNATLDSVATNAWFRIEGASLNLLAETDDATTDDDDNDTGDDIVDDTFHVFEIDCASLSAIKFMVDGTETHELSMADLPSNTMVQPYIIIQKDAGTEAEAVTIDYVHITWERS